MTIQYKTRQTIAVGFFFSWLIVLLAGADKPPPPGFLILIPLIAGCSYAVYRRIPAYSDWVATRKKWRYLAVIGDGITAGLLCALFPIIGEVFLSLSDQTVTMGVIDYLIWFVVLAVMGVINAGFIYFLTTFMTKRHLSTSKNVVKSEK